MYSAYFKVPFGNQNKYWVFKKCRKLVLKFCDRGIKGKKFETQVWRVDGLEKINQLIIWMTINFSHQCKSSNKKNKLYLQYQIIPSVVLPFAHSEYLCLHLKKLLKIYEIDLSSPAPTDEDETAKLFNHLKDIGKNYLYSI